MKPIRDAQTILVMLENGQMVKDFGNELTNTLSVLCGISKDFPKTKFKGNITLKLNIVAEAGTVNMQADISSKVPKLARRSNFYWVLEDGALSTEHPEQSNFFDTPRVVEKSA